jgi:hypothetical protein
MLLRRCIRLLGPAADSWGVQCRFFGDLPSFDYRPRDWIDVSLVRKEGYDVLHDPVYNKARPTNRLVFSPSARGLPIQEGTEQGLRAR